MKLQKKKKIKIESIKVFSENKLPHPIPAKKAKNPAEKILPGSSLCFFKWCVITIFSG